MPSHIHLILYINSIDLGNYIRDFKKFITQKAVRDLGINDQNIWMPRYDSVGLYSESVLLTKLKYIHNNPVRNGLVTNPADWKWSSAGDYESNNSGPIPIWKGWAGDD